MAEKGVSGMSSFKKGKLQMLKPFILRTSWRLGQLSRREIYQKDTS